jgi:hypothetical protein
VAARRSGVKRKTASTARYRPSEISVYFEHIFGLFVPGRKVSMFEVDTKEPGEMKGWEREDYLLVVEEGRRQLDRQGVDLSEIRGRAQYSATTGLALIALIVAGVRTVADAASPWPFLLWAIAIAASALGILGAAAVMVARKELGIIDTTLLSQMSTPILARTAVAYARTVRTGENTIATQITVYRDSVLSILVGVGLYGASWVLAVV